MPLPRSTALLFGALALLLGGCSSCRDGGQVPFALDSGTRSTGAHPEGPEEPGDVEAEEGFSTRSFPAETREAEVEGQHLAVEAPSALRALAEVDLDGDEDLDLLLLIEEPGQGPHIEVRRREEAGFADPIRPSASANGVPEAQRACAVEEASFARLSPQLALVSARLRCADQPELGSEERWILSLEATPRIREHLALLAPGEGRLDGELTLRFSASDQDGDHHDDLALTVELAGTSAELSWNDRTNGLIRDPSQPAARIGALALDARRKRRQNPEESLRDARWALSLYRGLCREGGQARLRLGARAGLPCAEARTAAGSAAASEVAALARGGELAAALASFSAMNEAAQRGEYELRESDRGAAREAIEGIPSTEGARVYMGPAYTSVVGEGELRSGLSFPDEDSLLLRDADGGPRLLHLREAVGPTEAPADGPPGSQQAQLPEGVVRLPYRAELLAAEAATEAAERRLLDPSGRFFLASVERDCAGRSLLVYPSEGGGSRGSAGWSLRPPHSRILLMPMLAPNLPACAEGSAPPAIPVALPDSLRTQIGELEALGWAPQGVLLAEGEALWLAPIDAEGHAAGEPSMLPANAPIPAPLTPGAATRDGRYYVTLTELAVTLHGPPTEPGSEERSHRLLWPPGWGALTGALDPHSSVAVSPSGQRVALSRGGRLYIIELGEALLSQVRTSTAGPAAPSAEGTEAEQPSSGATGDEENSAPAPSAPPAGTP